MHDPRIGRFFAVDPLTAKYPYYSSYAFSGNRVIDMIELEGLEPTDYESGLLAADSYNIYNGQRKEGEAHKMSPALLETGWELNSTVDLEETGVELTDEGSGFNSALYQRKTTDLDGNEYYEYAYVTQGSDPPTPNNLTDWGNNLQQPSGKVWLTSFSKNQYMITAKNAQNLNAYFNYSNKTLLTFVGHSLGGGLASLNARLTGRDAITFNAAALSPTTLQTAQRILGDVNYMEWTSNITAYIVENEAVDYFQGLIDLQAEHDQLIYLPSPSYRKGLIQRVKNHGMGVVLSQMRSLGIE